MADKVHVKGLADFQKGLRQINSDLGKELRLGLNEAAEVVAAEARSQVPVRTGAARQSIKPGSSQRAAAIKFGGTRAAYMPWLDFGGRVGRNKSIHRPFVRGGRYVYPALTRRMDDVIKKVDEVVDRLTRQAGF